MKISFKDKSYVEVRKSADDPNNVLIIISAKDQENPLKKITNCVEISVEDLKNLVSGLV